MLELGTRSQDRRTMSKSLIFSIQLKCKSHLVKSDSLCSLFYFSYFQKEEIRWWKQICPWISQCTDVVRASATVPWRRETTQLRVDCGGGDLIWDFCDVKLQTVFIDIRDDKISQKYDDIFGRDNVVNLRN